MAVTTAPAQTPDGTIPYRFFEANGIPVHYVEYGAGIPVVALHGWAVDHHYMTAVLEPVFADRSGGTEYRRIYVDSPGMGRTPAPESIASTADMLEVILAFIDGVLGKEPFLIAGHSHGGYLARGVVDRRPGQVKGLALINPMGRRAEKAQLPAHVVLHRSGNLDGILEPALEAEYSGYLVIQTPETLRLFAEREGPGIASADGAALERIYKDFFLPEPPETGEPFTRPTLILTGRQDSFTGYVPGWEWLPHYPRASYVVLDGAGHGLPHEQVSLTTALLGEWLDRVARDVE